MRSPDLVTTHLAHRERVRKMETGVSAWLPDPGSGVYEDEWWVQGGAYLRIIADVVTFLWVGPYPGTFTPPDRYRPAREVVVPLYYGTRRGEWTFAPTGDAVYTGESPFQSGPRASATWTRADAETGQAPA